MLSRCAPLVLVLLAACLPDGLSNVTETGSTGDPGTGEQPTSGGDTPGLFACDSPPCKLVMVSQTLDDRVDIYDVTGTPSLRGRISLDLKPDPSGQQISGNLLDEPYELALTATSLIVTIGHYPDTDQGSLIRFPLTAFADVPAGGIFTVDRYFTGGSFSDGVAEVAHGRREGIFLLPHPSGRLLVGVFANDLKTTEWTNPSSLLVLDSDLAAVPASIDLGALDKPCIGAWHLAALDAEVSRVAVACDGSDSVAVLTLPGDFATASIQDAAAGVTGCGLNLSSGLWTTQFVAADGAGNLIAVQSQLAESPRLWQVHPDCSTGKPSQDAPPGLEQVRLLREPVLLRGGSGDAARWLVASGPTDPGVVIVKGGATPTMCGRLGGLDLLAAANAPWALALDASGEHLAIGAGPPSNPELAEGRGQVLWATLDRSKLDACEVAATDLVDLNAGRFLVGAPETWVRAPNVVVIAEIGAAS
ncbi:hypothetical protein [Nannocystis sp.]|uniref:hypothetical protein n=1 Tax=Nannocystis sp. TaxID=1962667 RepID=UPI0025D6F2D6|nr:hypothetical protein [Nannocystis sp.]MBK7824682.1 hypothetical protein [Nannocystis sp.]